MRRRDVLRIGAGTAAAAVSSTAAVGSTAAAIEEEPLGRLIVPRAKELVVSEDVAYVAATDGFATVDTADPTDPTLLAERRGLLSEHPDGPLENIYDGKVGGDYYALGGPANERAGVPYAAMVFDVSDPTDPQEVLTYETDFYHHNLDTDGETLYLCGNDGGDNPLVCVDIERGEELGRWSVVDADERWADVDHRLRQLHDVWVEDDIAYCAYWNAGTWLVDVSDPSDPSPIVGLRGLDPTEQADIEGDLDVRNAQVGLPGNDHFAMPRRHADGDFLALNEEAWADDPDAPESEFGGVEIWDAEAEERLARIGAPPTDDATYGGAWTTAHNFDFVGDRLYTSWYRGGVRVHDVSDPSNPREVFGWRDSETTEFWTAQQGRPGEYFLASSWQNPSSGQPQEDAAIYTFPDPSDGEGVDSGIGIDFIVAAFGVTAVAAAVIARRLRS